ncbi:MAG TPA: EAL domain-containing protein [Rubrivivax sp.]|nr:EAL domain-containing protein [Rubrivivax sp.]
MSVAPDGLALLDALPDAAWLVELAGLRVSAANAAAGRLFGCAPAGLVGRAADALVASPEDRAYWAAAAAGEPGELHSDTVLALDGEAAAAAPDPSPATPAAPARADGAGADGPHAPPVPRVLHASRSIRLVAAVGDGCAHALVVVRDRSDEQRMDEERELRLGELQATLESTIDGLLVTDLDGRIRSFNRRFAQMWALPASLLEQRDDGAIDNWLGRHLPDDEAYRRRVVALRAAPLVSASDRLELADGRVFERVTRPLWRSGRPQGRVWSFRDLSEQIAARQRIESLERADALTGLPNRRSLGELVEAAARTLGRGGAGFALMVVDLDRFRHVNDSLGHDVGDRVLQDCATRIGGCLRAGDVLARIGGDQFAVLLAPADAKAAETTARRVLNVVAQPCSVAGAEFTLTCSIGIALAPAHGRSADELMRHAEDAVRAVKAGGRAGVRLHQLRAADDRRADLRLEHAMRQALVSGRFRLQYQPQLRLADGVVIGAEALLRWRDPELGEVPPQRFIPVAEESGFIVPIGDWVLAQAVRQAVLWHQRGLAVPIAVNVSALQFQQPHFVERVASVLAVAGLPAGLLELELTESILLHDAEEALARLCALARIGVRLAIDDFGTGYSSLVYLKRFPIDKLKIDRSFVRGLPDDASDAGIVQAILQMARALGKRVIAEGVETEAQRQFLQAAGCEEFQGWLYAPALDPLSLEQRLADAAPERCAPPRMRLVSG